MGRLRNIRKAISVLVLAGGCWRAPAYAQTKPSDQPRNVFQQSAARVLDREFTDDTVSYLLFDVRSGNLLTSRWENEAEPIPLGSLIKPFTALAYAEAHEYHYPVAECGGKVGGCWQMQSHGKLDIVAATSVSCNSYFRSLAEGISEQQIGSIARLFDLEAPDREFSTATLIGVGGQWRISPTKMAKAYLELYRRRDQPGVADLIAGMRQSAKRGTGVAVGRALGYTESLVKTGTASCSHTPHAPGDGFVVVMVPASQPEILLMIRVHGVPGAKAAETAGHMLQRMEE